MSQIEAGHGWHVGVDDVDDGDDSHQLVVSQVEAGQGGDVDGAGRQGGEHVVAEIDLEVIHGYEDDGIVGDGEDFTRHNFVILIYVQDDGDKLALWVLIIVVILLTHTSVKDSEAISSRRIKFWKRTIFRC